MFVYYRMKNITLSADEALIEKREKAQQEHTTLNNRFRGVVGGLYLEISEPPGEYLKRIKALDGNCKILYSEDLQDRQKIGSLEIVNPFK
jgi:hypothetical protein